MKPMLLTKEHAQRVLEVVDEGLCSGLGIPIPGHMCVEAAVCFALGLPHGDNPPCVSDAVRSIKIKLNDSAWSDFKARAKGLRRLAVAQLGSRDVINDQKFVIRVSDVTIRVLLPKALRILAPYVYANDDSTKLELLARECETKGTRLSCLDAYSFLDEIQMKFFGKGLISNIIRAKYVAWGSANSSNLNDCTRSLDYISMAFQSLPYVHKLQSYNENDVIYSDIAELIVQILIDMKSPGCEFLYLCQKDT